MIQSSLRKPLTVCAVLILAAILIALSPTNAAAVPTTYTYTGNVFTLISDLNPPAGTYLNTDSISGSFTLANALPANFTFQTISPTAFSFFDGRSTITSSSPGVRLNQFLISTDAAANISLWQISMDTSVLINVLGDQAAAILTSNTATAIGDLAFLRERVLGGFNQSDSASVSIAGVWSAQVIPEPSTMLLLGSGLAGLGFFRWRKKARSIEPANIVTIHLDV